MDNDRAAYEADIKKRLEEGRKRAAQPRMMMTESDLKTQKEESVTTTTKTKRKPTKKSLPVTKAKSNGAGDLDVKALTKKIEKNGPQDGLTPLQREILLYCAMRPGKEVHVDELLDALVPADEIEKANAAAKSADRKAHRIIRNAIRTPRKRNLLYKGEKPATYGFVIPTKKDDPNLMARKNLEAILYVQVERRRRGKPDK